MKFCPNCGAQNQDENPKCIQCQTPLSTSNNLELLPAKITNKSPKRKRKIITLIVIIISMIIIFSILIFSHIICINHKWEQATCKSPKTCQFCGLEDGEPLGHTIIIDEAILPTCTEKGLTEGKHCKTCDKILVPQFEIDMTEHTEGDWHLTKEATLVSKGSEEILCSVCETVLDSRSTSKKEPKATGDSFNFTDEEFIDWLNDISTAYVSHTELELDGLDSKNTSYKVTVSDGENGALIFNHNDNGNIRAIMVYFEDYINSIALAAFIGEEIDYGFSAEDALLPLVSNEAYASSGMTLMRLELDVDFEVAVLAPNAFIEDILS